MSGVCYNCGKTSSRLLPFRWQESKCKDKIRSYPQPDEGRLVGPAGELLPADKVFWLGWPLKEEYLFCEDCLKGPVGG